jgi:hypothetical protein
VGFLAFQPANWSIRFPLALSEHRMAAIDSIEQRQSEPLHQWFYLIGEEHFGPVSNDQLRAMLRSGKLTRETFVFREGLTAWIPISECPDVEAPAVCSKSLFLWWPETVTGSALLTTAVFCLLFGMWAGAGEFLNGVFSSAVVYSLTMGSRVGLILLLNVARCTSKLALNKPARVALRQPALIWGWAVGILLGSVLFMTLGEMGENTAIKLTGVTFLLLGVVGFGRWFLRRHFAVNQSGARHANDETSQHTEAGSTGVGFSSVGNAASKVGSTFGAWPWRKIGWGVGIFCVAICTLWLAAWIVAEVSAVQANRQAELRRQAEEQRLAEEQRQQAANPEMRRQTLQAWRQIQTVEASLSELYRQQATPETLFSKRAYLFTQVDLDQADPLLVQWVRDSIANANGFLGVLEQVAAEQKKAREFNQGAETFFRVLGTIAGAMANNDRSAQDNIQVGQVAGDLVGKGSSLLINSATTSEIERNYGPQFGTLNATRNKLAQQRKELGAYLSQKYGANLLDAN